MTMHECCSVDWGDARRAAQHLLKSAYRVDLRKELDPLKDKDFMVIVQQLSDQLKTISGPLERASVSRAMQLLDVDFQTLTGAQAAELAKAVNLSVRGVSSRIMPEVTGTLRTEVSQTIGQTKIRAAKKYRWTVRTGFDQVDQRMTKAIGSIASWVTDEYGQRAAMMELGIQNTIMEGFSKGLRNEEIAEDLRALGEKVLVKKSASYWELVSTNITNRARNFGHLRTMEDAGVREFVFSAVMDERTSAQCSALNGTQFSVQTGLRSYSDLELQTQGDYQAADKVMPFVKRKDVGEGITELFVQPPGLGRTVLGRLDRASGKVEGMLSPSQLAAAGVSAPPIHHKCRSTIEPVI